MDEKSVSSVKSDVEKMFVSFASFDDNINKSTINNTKHNGKHSKQLAAAPRTK